MSAITEPAPATWDDQELQAYKAEYPVDEKYEVKFTKYNPTPGAAHSSATKAEGFVATNIGTCSAAMTAIHTA